MMTSRSAPNQELKHSSQQPWKNIENICKDAAVFLDDSCGELLHWAGGVELLKGSMGVYDLYSDLPSLARDYIASVSCV